MSSIDESTDTDNNGMEVDVRVDDAVLASDATTVNDRDDEATPRLMITRMELENFKSYAGVQEIGPFHKCFSSVVGPNGSGKSNVIDALLFVFGKRAKQLRLNRVSELIHKSSHHHPTSARVSVYFQEIVDTVGGPNDENDEGEEGYRVIPNSQCVLTRVAKKDNSSTYKLNGKTCQFREVATFLGTKGIDLDNNRFLILQGEVEMISMMPPKGKTEDDEGLLEYLEDIIGSSKYVEQTNEVAARVEALGELRQEKFNRVKAVEKEKDGLLSAKQEAQALLNADRDIRRKQNILYQINMHEAKTQKETHAERLEQVLSQLQAERDRLSTSNQRLAEIQEGLAPLKKEHKKVYDELVQTKEEFTAFERRDIKLKEEIKHAGTLKKKLEKKVEAETKKETDALASGTAAEESIPLLEEQIGQLTEYKASEDAKLEEIFDEMKGVTQKLRAELEVKTQELAPIQQEKASFQNNLDTAETEVKLLKEATTRAQEKLEKSEKELAHLDENQQKKREDLASCEDELEQSKAGIMEAEQELAELADKEQKLVAKSKDLMARSEDAKASLQSKGGVRSKALTGIMKAAKSGELSKAGVLGRLGDLATIHEEYDVAISTACGSLDSIVVQTTAGAQKCLEFLRKHNLGRASFIPLDRMKKGAHDRAVETPENAPRLFELISPLNMAVTPAIFQAVGNTLVAPDIDTATRWSFDYGKRWRVVTLDGKLVESAGTMSGGGKSVKKGGMKLSNRKVSASNDSDEESMDCTRLEEELEKCQAFIKECRNRRKTLTEEIKQLKKRVKALEIKLPKLSVEIGGFDTTRSELTKLIPELRKQCELSDKDAAKLVELNKVVNKCKTELSTCAMKASKLESEVARLQKAILDAGGSRLKNQQKSCDEALAELKKAEKALNSAKVTITSSEKAAKKAAAAKESAEKELEECVTSLAAKKTERKSLEEDALAVMQAYEEVMAIESEKKAELDAVTKEYEDLEKSLASVKVLEIELLGKVEAGEKQVAECEQKQAHWANAIDKLRSAAEEEDDMDLSDDEGEEDDASSHASKEESMSPDDASAMSEDTEMKEVDESAEEPKKKEGSSALPSYPPATLQKYSKDAIKEEISILEAERNTIAKNANMGAIAEYRKKEADYLARVEELDKVTEEKNAVRKQHDDLRRQRLEMFMDGFGKITLKLKEMYQMITLGGDAELELVDSLDPFSEGIVFSVRPPKKSWKNISNLSGGEKTLSSLALVFALHHFKPTPLYVMDEIDAALDFKNVSIVANYIKDRTKNAQFVIISLRNNMFELADRLVGIYKTNNCTKSVTIDPSAFGVQGQQNGYVPPTPAPPALAENTNTNKREGNPSAAKESVRRRVSFQSAAETNTSS